MEIFRVYLPKIAWHPPGTLSHHDCTVSSHSVCLERWRIVHAQDAHSAWWNLKPTSSCVMSLYTITTLMIYHIQITENNTNVHFTCCINTQYRNTMPPRLMSNKTKGSHHAEAPGPHLLWGSQLQSLYQIWKGIRFQSQQFGLFQQALFPLRQLVVHHWLAAKKINAHKKLFTWYKKTTMPNEAVRQRKLVSGYFHSLE